MNAEKTLELTLDKEPYNPDHFVNRKEELQALVKKVKQGRLGFNIKGPLFNLWGMQGIGKTWLLHEFQRLYQYGGVESKAADAPRATCAVYYDFEKEEKRDVTAVTKSIAQTILYQLPGGLLTEHNRENLESAAQDGEPRYLTDALKGMLDRYLPILLLDTTENLSSDFWQELEEALIEPLLASNKVIVVIAGRRAAPRWKRAEVRRRAAPSAAGYVTPLGEDALEELFGLLVWPQPRKLAELLHVYTGGNPLLAVNIGRTLFEEEKLASSDLTENVIREPALQILQKYEDSVFKNLSAALREKLEKLGVLRFYRTEALRYMLSEPDGEPLNDVALLRILRQLDKETEAVWWDDGRNGYVTSPVMRQVLNHRLRLQQPKQFKEKHQKALSLYWDWVDRYPENGAIYLAEICYHQANLDWKEEPLPELADFNRILQHAESLEVDKRMILPEKIRQDEELERLLLPAEFERIIAQLEKSLNQ